MDLSIKPNLPAATGRQLPTEKVKTSKNLKALRESCREFESLFIHQMYAAMRKTVPDGGLIPKDNATRIYQDMLDMQMARETAKGKGTGIGEAMYNQMKAVVQDKR